MNLDQSLPPSAEDAAALVREHLAAGHTISLTVLTDSMAPAIVRGDHVIVTSVCPGELRFGDIVVQQSGEVRRVHRLIGRRWRDGQLFLWTKGDGSADPDAAWNAAELLGLVVAVDRSGIRRSQRSRRARWLAWIAAGLSLAGWEIRRLPGDISSWRQAPRFR